MRARHVSINTKRKVFTEYGIAWADRHNYEVDHLISLALGGSNEIVNLWPEPYAEPAGAHTKDRYENWLHKQVCRHGMPLVAAQNDIAHDWYTHYITAGKP